jgi:hypothetical protein
MAISSDSIPEGESIVSARVNMSKGKCLFVAISLRHALF